MCACDSCASRSERPGLDPGGDSVAFALLQLYRFNPCFVSWTIAGPSHAAEPGLLLGPLPGEALKGYMHMPSFHSHIRTSQGHRSEVSSSPLRARCLPPHLSHTFTPSQASASIRETDLPVWSDNLIMTQKQST